MERLTDEGPCVDSRKNHLVLCIAYNHKIWMHALNGDKMNRIQRRKRVNATI
ncbi:MAG: hypothetical protein Hyperionvirus23_38 [Hyperionvirus sp.]|uniref:Uncharacterized protein n=1 Tax=Hyperionvirus sp. TaxID=2487770 RepID=A0A3G5ADM8_9VIRU|nr:MAG: hypothetical protein Hyperionvirus23_38 [Hyperionvirus sp.]